jgi:hypothetical protein
MAYNLNKAFKSNLTTAVNTFESTVNTVSNDLSSAASNITGSISSVTGLSTQKVNASLLGAAAGGLLNGNKGAALGALAGGLLGGGGATNLISQVQTKLSGLIDNALELQGLINEPLKLVEKGAADLIGITGGENGLILAQYREQQDSVGILDYINNTFLPSYKGSDSSASKLPNPLRDHNGFNYTITLGILDPAEYNNPELYRATGFKNYVIRSGGGNLSKRYQTFDEKAGNIDGVPQLGYLGAQDHAEYYIDDINLEAVIAPNPNTRMSLGTNVNFVVTEPYSMGNFIQAIIGSASDAGYSAYSQAPFCLKIDFNGWNTNGETDANFLQQPIFVPIQIINMDLKVSGQGSKYDVTAIPMSETGLSDNINQIKSAIRASGTFCHEVLETNDQSVTGGINRAIQDMEEAGALAPYDRYVICFPRNRKELKDALQAGNVDESAFTTSTEEQEVQRRGYTGPDDGIRGSFSPEIITISKANQLYATLKTFAENTNLMNAIGKSPINEDTNAPGNVGEADVQSATNPETGLVDPANKSTQTPDKARDHQFSQGENLTDIIEKTVLQTLFCAENSTKESPNGLTKWFRIDTQVYIEDGALTESTMGRRPKIYVYSVIEYEIDEAVTAASNKRSKNTAGLRELAVKEYNYIYTGKNEDVLNFDINFNNAFMMAAYADLGMNTAELRDPNGSKTTASKNSYVRGGNISGPGDLESNDDASGGTELINAVAMPTAGTSNDIRRKIAETFQDRITNMNVDMITADMEIMGDPYFIPQQTGNYVAADGANPSITEDGTMNVMDRSVFCIINFKTPFDYQVTGATMEMPQIVTGFSGLYQVISVINTFSAGKFTQTLKLLRRKGQDDKATTGASGVVQPNSSATLNKDGNQSDGVVGQSGQPSTDCFPAPANDDVRQINPAIGADVVAELAAPFEQLSEQLSTLGDQFSKEIKGVDFGVAAIPDLTKVIPTLNNFTSGLSNSPMVGIGSVSSARVRGAMGAIRPTDGMNALDVLAEEAVIINRAAAAVNNAASIGIDAATDAAKSRVKNLLGGPR